MKAMHLRTLASHTRVAVQFGIYHVLAIEPVLDAVLSPKADDRRCRK
jgi:hypothetical protein